MHQKQAGKDVDKKSEIDSGVVDRVQDQSIWLSRLRPNGHGIVEVGPSEISKE